MFEVSNSRTCRTHESTVFAPVVRGEDPDRESALRAASEHPADRGEDLPGQVHGEARPVVRVQRERIVPDLPDRLKDGPWTSGPFYSALARAEEGRPASERARETTSHGFGPVALLGA